MKKLQIYLDTSVISFAVSTQNVGDKRKVTLKLLEQIRKNKFEAYVSVIVLDEIKRASETKRQELFGVLQGLPIVELQVTEEVTNLAEDYIKAGIIPKKYEDDAFHLALASVNKLDVVVSWNFNHLVKVKTRREVREVNNKMEYSQIDIATPEEVVQDERA